MPSLPVAGFLLVAFTVVCASCDGMEISRYYITPDPETSCGEDRLPCLTLDQFASNYSENINESVLLFLIPGHHTITRSIAIFCVDNFSILAKTSVRIQCTSPASFVFEDISILEIINTTIVSCGGGGSSGALQVRSVQQLDIRNVTLQESASVSLTVQDSNGLVTGARFVGNTGAGMNITTSTIIFEGNNAFSDNLDGGIASYNSKLQFSGVNQFINNTATNGGGISAISSTINCSGNMTFENNSAEQYGGGVYASDTRMTSEGHIMFAGNTLTELKVQDDCGGGGLFAGDESTVDFRDTISFVSNHAFRTSVYYLKICSFGGGLYATKSSTVHISGANYFTENSAQDDGGGVYAEDSTIDISGTNYFTDNSASRGGGVYAMHSTMHISGTDYFIDNSASWNGGGVYAFNCTIDISGASNFIDNSASSGGGVYAWYSTIDISGRNYFTDNSALWYGGGVCAMDSNIDISGENYFTDNSALVEGGGVYASNSIMDISGTSNFMDNSAQESGGGVYAQNNAVVYISGISNIIYNSAQESGGGVYAEDATIDISGTSNFINNSAQVYGGGIALHQSAVGYLSGHSSFTRNSASVRGGGMYVVTSCRAYINGHSLFSDNWSQYGGGISAQRSEISFKGSITLSNNSASYGGAIQAFEANINITGNGRFTKNLARVNGGALALAGGSVVHIVETASLTFSQNIAGSFGGAIYIEDNSVHCSYENINGFLTIEDRFVCLFHKLCHSDDICYCLHYGKNFYSFKGISFSGNSAVAGSAIFGGEIDETIAIINCHYPNAEINAKISDLFYCLGIVTIDATNNGSKISSNPNRICRCINGQPDCSDPPSPYEVSVYPGQTVGVSLVAVGQRNGTVPSTINAQFDPDDGASFGDLQVKQSSNPTCTEIYYTIFSKKETATFKIHADGSCGLEGIPLSVNVILLDCPIGYTLSNSSKQCVCEERLQKYTNSCNIGNLEITRTASDAFWVGVDNNINGSEGLILHPHCPFDYCTTETVHFTPVDSNTNNASLNNTDNSINRTDTHTNANETDATDNAIGDGIDAQCNYNRSGLLCGKCQKGFSLVFGNSKCLKCSNSYLSLLIAFALVGLILVIFLFILKLTVAVGTINGLIFYANIVSVNRAQLFPSGETNILTVFIAWVNLDLGIETCFFDGMDAYSKAWLQYAFPIYVWVLVGSIILASRHSTRIVRILGNNPVAVLATLFLLSYAKLLRSIINPLFVTFLEYPSDSKAVWLVDGNTPYLKGKHISLFLSSLLALFLLFIPFTLLLLLGQWIQAQSERKCCFWISDYRITTFLDVYHGPFKNKHRYWCGLLLGTRFCLFLVFAFNVNGDLSINILAIALCLIGVIIILVCFKVYKAWYLNVLEASFIINLLVLAISTNYVDVLSGGNQNALTYTSVSVAFATFCGIFVYHCCLQIKDSNLSKKYKTFIHSLKPSADDSGAGEIEMKIEEDPPRKYTKPPTTMVVELTH